MGNLVSGSAERPGNPIDAAEIPIVRDNDVAIGQGARPTERPEKTTASARHNGAQRGADAESAEKRIGAKNLPKQDGQPNILVPETPEGAIRLPKPLFGVVEETPEMTSLFASPDSGFASRPVDPDDTERKTPALTEHQTQFGSRNDLRTGNTENAERTPAPKTKEHRSPSSPTTDRLSRKSQTTDRTHQHSQSFGTPKGLRKRLHWAEIEDVLAPTKIDESSSDTESSLPVQRRIVDRIVDRLIRPEKRNRRRELKLLRLPLPKTSLVPDLSRNTSSSRRNLMAPDHSKPS